MKNCLKCSSVNITHEERRGRGLPPKDYKGSPFKKISWSGIWDYWTCKDCGDITSKLRR